MASSETSIKRGLDFINRIAGKPEGFDSYGSLLICCFALMGATSRDASLRQLARSRAQKLAQRWGRLHPVVPPDATTNLVLDFVLVRYALSRLGLRMSHLTRKYALLPNGFQFRTCWASTLSASRLRMICLTRASVA